MQDLAIVSKLPATERAAMPACVIDANAALAMAVELPRAIKSAAPLRLATQTLYDAYNWGRLCKTGKRRLLSDM